MSSTLYNLPWYLQISFTVICLYISIFLWNKQSGISGLFASIFLAAALLLILPPVHEHILPIIFPQKTANSDSNLVGIVTLVVTFLSGISFKIAKDSSDYAKKQVDEKLHSFDTNIEEGWLERKSIKLYLRAFADYQQQAARRKWNTNSYHKSLDYSQIIYIYESTEPSPELISNINTVARQPKVAKCIKSDGKEYFSRLKQQRSENKEFTKALDNLLAVLD
ncbi:hypothetical protein D0S45_19760 [Marinifilum sp. JC120]|nr:hypothetical protein D0S45_19760 [Marinifilum sp. JC120]